MERWRHSLQGREKFEALSVYHLLKYIHSLVVFRIGFAKRMRMKQETKAYTCG
jgi:hypothetical protein